MKNDADKASEISDRLRVKRSFLGEWFSYKGRMKRWAFWWRYILISFLFSAGVLLVNKNVPMGHQPMHAGWVGALLCFGEFLLFIALTAPLITKRLHDGGFGTLLYWVAAVITTLAAAAYGFEKTYEIYRFGTGASYTPVFTAATLHQTATLFSTIPNIITFIRLFWASDTSRNGYEITSAPSSKPRKPSKFSRASKVVLFYALLSVALFFIIYRLYINHHIYLSDSATPIISTILLVGIGKLLTPWLSTVISKAKKAYQAENPGNAIAYMFIWCVVSVIWALIAFIPILLYDGYCYPLIHNGFESAAGFICAVVCALLVQAVFYGRGVLMKKAAARREQEQAAFIMEEQEPHSTPQPAPGVYAGSGFWAGWFSYTGRLNAWGFWIRFIITWLVLELGFYQLNRAAYELIQSHTSWMYYVYIQAIIHTIVSVVVYAPLYIRRLHDVGIRARVFWVYAVIECVVHRMPLCHIDYETILWLNAAEVIIDTGVLIIATLPSQRGENKYGAQPAPWEKKWYKIAGFGVLILLSCLILCKSSWSLTREILRKVGGEDWVDYVGEVTHLEQKPDIDLTPNFIMVPHHAEHRPGVGLAAAILRDKGMRYRKQAGATKEFARLSADDPTRIGAYYRAAFGSPQLDMLSTFYKQLPQHLQEKYAEPYKRERIERWKRDGDVAAASDELLGKMIIELARFLYMQPNGGRYVSTRIYFAGEKELQAAMHERGLLAAQKWDSLLKQGVDLNCVVSDGAIKTTPLLYAVGHADLPLIKKLQQNGASFEVVTSDIPTVWDALFLYPRTHTPPAGASAFTMALYLLDQGVSPDAKLDITHIVRQHQDEVLDYGRDALKQLNTLNDEDLADARREQQTKLKEELSQHIYTTPLHIFASERNVQVVQALLDKKAAILNVGYNGTPLHMAARQQGNTDIIRLLIQHGAPINDCNSNGMTPLMSAIFSDCSSNASLLINSGADVNAGTNASALMYACAKKNVQIIRMLLAHGATPTPHQWQTNRASVLRVAILTKEPQIIRIILDAGASPDDKDQEGLSDGALLYALSETEPRLQGILSADQERKYLDEVLYYQATH